MRIGYNTNGLAHHDGFEAIELLGSIGYESVALTLDHGMLNPYAEDLARNVSRMKQLLSSFQMASVVETGARYLLDPKVKHEPTLMSPEPRDRARRVDFLNRAIDIAGELGSDCVSLWSGILHAPVGNREALERLMESLTQVLEYAEGQGVVLGFEPEPGMFIDTMMRFETLARKLGGREIGLTLDVGHLHCQGEVPLPAVIQHWGARLVNVHIEDMKTGRHEHLMFGDGEIEFPPVIAALRDIGYDGGMHVELSRHSHEGAEAAQRAFDFLKPLMPP